MPFGFVPLKTARLVLLAGTYPITGKVSNGEYSVGKNVPETKLLFKGRLCGAALLKVNTRLETL